MFKSGYTWYVWPFAIKSWCQVNYMAYRRKYTQNADTYNQVHAVLIVCFRPFCNLDLCVRNFKMLYIKINMYIYLEWNHGHFNLTANTLLRRSYTLTTEKVNKQFLKSAYGATCVHLIFFKPLRLTTPLTTYWNYFL